MYQSIQDYLLKIDVLAVRTAIFSTFTATLMIGPSSAPRIFAMFEMDDATRSETGDIPRKINQEVVIEIVAGMVNGTLIDMIRTLETHEGNIEEGLKVTVMMILVIIIIVTEGDDTGVEVGARKGIEDIQLLDRPSPIAR